MLESLLDYLRQEGGPVAYLLLALAAGIEYVFPPFPGDTVVLFGAFLAVTAGFSPTGVYLVMTAGSIVGGMATYFLGRFFGDDRRRLPRWLRTKRARWALARIDEQFHRYGAVYLALNRFLPAMRAFFFVGAGLTRMPVGRVLLFGGLSAALWNALILSVAYVVGANWERLQELGRQYATVAFVLVALVAAGWVLRWWISRGRREGGGDPDR
ncbi:MAG: DedA family protein [Myxococcota bacterium]